MDSAYPGLLNVCDALVWECRQRLLHELRVWVLVPVCGLLLFVIIEGTHEHLPLLPEGCSPAGLGVCSVHGCWPAVLRLSGSLGKVRVYV